MAKKRVGANRKRSVVKRKKKIVRSFFIIMLVVVAAGAVVTGGMKGFGFLKTYVDESAILDVKDVVIDGALRSTIDSIRVKQVVAPGMKLYRVIKKKVTDAFLNDKWIDKIEVKKRLDGVVFIKIKERKPIAVVNIGEIQYVDRDGVLLPFTSVALLEVPLFIGLKDSVDVEGKRLLKREDLIRIVTFLEETKKITALNTIVSQVDFSRSNRIRLSCRSSKVLLDIDPQHITESLIRLTYVEPVLKNQSGKPALINMMYQDLAFIIQEGGSPKGSY
jgi:cell division septal protein FtsQ